MPFNADQIVTLIEVFHDEQIAHAAIRELREVGFSESQIDVTSTVRKSVTCAWDVNRPRIPQIIVSVKAGTRADIAASILNRFNRFDRTPAQAM